MTVSSRCRATSFSSLETWRSTRSGDVVAPAWCVPHFTPWPSSGNVANTSSSFVSHRPMGQRDVLKRSSVVAGWNQCESCRSISSGRLTPSASRKFGSHGPTATTSFPALIVPRLVVIETPSLVGRQPVTFSLSLTSAPPFSARERNARTQRSGNSIPARCSRIATQSLCAL